MGLGAMALAVLVIANDFTALSCGAAGHRAGVRHGRHLPWQWVITGYALVFGVLIVTGGRLADMFAAAHLFYWRGIFVGVLGDRRLSLTQYPGYCSCARGAHGRRRCPDVARDPRHDLRVATDELGRRSPAP